MSQYYSTYIELTKKFSNGFLIVVCGRKGETPGEMYVWNPNGDQGIQAVQDYIYKITDTYFRPGLN